ncbi:MAG: imidazole glycerol phosphate synthase subunit HisH [Candidatus Micrarchaeia archaeon]
MESRIGIMNFGLGNVRSLQNALCTVGADAVVSADKRELSKCDGIVLPGVGAFEAGRTGLAETGLDKFAESCFGKKPLLGICLGLQLLFDESGETFSGKKSAAGLGAFAGKVVRFKETGLKVPQVGWNRLDFPKESVLFRGVENGSWAYFVHSYYAKPALRAEVSAWTAYGKTRFASAVENAEQKLFATQFHPEKSGSAGLKILENFVDFCKK